MGTGTGESMGTLAEGRKVSQGRGGEWRGAHGKVFLVHGSRFAVHGLRFTIRSSRFMAHA